MEGIDTYFESFYNSTGSERISQGDIFAYSKEPLSEKRHELGVIVVSNACDIEHGRADYISHIPIFSCNNAISQKKDKNERNWKKILKQNHHSYFYLAPDGEYLPEYGAVALFRNIRSMSLADFTQEYNDPPALRLSELQRDKLSNRISQLFNRIPINHPTDPTLEEWIKDKIEPLRKKRQDIK